MSSMTPYRSESFPWHGLRDLEDRINRFFFGMPGEPITAGSSWMPVVDLNETDDAYILEAELPGLTKDDISLSVQNDVVTLKGKRERKSEEKKDGFSRIERSYGSFERSFRVPGGVDTAKVDAKFDNGVLRVTLPKPEESKPRQIEVKID